MDLELTREQREFRDEARDWLRANAPKTPLASPATREGFEQHRAWEKQLYEAGLAAVHWPKEYGGRAMDPMSTAIFYDEYLAVNGPARVNKLGLGLAGPTLIDRGTDAQKNQWLDNIVRCDEVWCQGFSEPDAGSDLASVRTRGEVGDTHILVNGHKIWTSHSRFANWMFALVRTDPSAPKHKGLTFLMLPMNDPGVDWRELRQMNGAADFAEVFLTDVEVPKEHVIGDVNDGWRVAMTTLTHERGSGLNTAAHFHRVLRDVMATIPAARRDSDYATERIGQFYEEIEAYRYMTLRTLSELSSGRRTGAQASMGKLWWSEMQTRILEFGLEMLGDEVQLTDATDGRASTLRQDYWLSRASHIYAGTDEIQRNIISERVLGLPKETNGVL